MRQVSEYRRIAVLLHQELGYCRRVMAGILRFADERQPGWLFRDGPADARLLDGLQEWRPHGVIAHVDDPELAAGLAKLGCPLVSTTETIGDPGAHVVDVEHEEVGRQAARHLLMRGYRHFAFYGSSTAGFSRRREKGFRELVEQKGYPVSSFHAEFRPMPEIRDIWRVGDGLLEEWLHGLEKPVGMLCSNDIPARRIVDLCRLIDIQVPGGVAVMGVDNDTSECRLVQPKLSSVDTPAENIGYAAAGMLRDLIQGKRNVPKQLFLPPSHVVVRGSTDRWAGEDGVARRAMKLIRVKALKGVRVDEVARLCGVSRRRLERAFRGDLNCTVLSAIHAVQVEHARELLATTELPVGVISERCGFQDPSRFRAVFRGHTGVSPRAFRMSGTS